MNTMTEELKALLLNEGATIVGVGDLKGIAEEPYTCGISVAVAAPPAVIAGIKDYPTEDYRAFYVAANRKLDELARACAAFLTSRGFAALAQTSDVVRRDEHNRTRLPHKTVATRAGLGWIGKCALLVTKEYGSALRLTSILTDAPLACAEPVTESRCGNCTVCRDECPGQAVSGTLWQPTLDRDDFFNAARCHDTTKERTLAGLGREAAVGHSLCGKCIESCPHTQKYLRRELRSTTDEAAEGRCRDRHRDRRRGAR